MQLDKNQEKAVFAKGKSVLVLAGAGSGKTRVLTERIAHLVEDEKVSPYEILSFTFTRKAAQEMKTRLEDRLGSTAHNVTMGTMHSLALSMLHRFGEIIGMRPNSITVYGAWEEAFLLKEIAKEMGVFKKGWNPKKADIDLTLNNYYQKGIVPNELDKTYPLFKAFMARCRENNSLTYGGLLIGLEMLIDTMAKHLHYKHILVDEVQDIDPLQWRIINKMVEAFGASLFVVGDIDQCQPEGTMVITTNGAKPIESLDPEKDELKVYCKHDAMIYGGHNKGYKFSIKKRKFTGILRTIRVKGGKATSCTDNHKWYVKWSDWARDHKWNVVYLMKKGNRFRIGWCQLFRNGHPGIHFYTRVRLEGADCAWILRFCDTKKQASLLESILAAQYGIPTITFKATNNAKYYDQEGIDYVFNSLWHLETNAKKILSDHKLSMAHPFFNNNGDHKKQGGKTIFQISTHNLRAGFFCLPQKEGTRFIKWSPIKDISFENVEKLSVYSLDVEKYHTYVADGLCTCNSIYSFRGAVPEYLLEHQDEFDIYRLELNYRSDLDIVYSANQLIVNNSSRLEKTMIATRNSNKDVVTVKRNFDSNFLAGYLKGIVELEAFDLKDMAILSRNHILLKKLSSILKEENVPHTYVGRKTELTRSEEFRRFHAVLKLIVNPYDNFAFLLIKDFINLSDGEYSKVRFRSIMEGKSHFQAWKDNYRESWWRDIEIASRSHDLGGLVRIMGESLGVLFNTKDICDFILKWENDHPKMKDIPSEVGPIILYLDWLATYDLQDEITEETEGIQLMTIHGAKGLEFPIVIIAGMNEGLLPSKQAISSDNIEDERRLCYVAVTRAEDHLILTARPETKESKSGKIYHNPISRFIKEMDIQSREPQRANIEA